MNRFRRVHTDRPHSGLAAVIVGVVAAAVIAVPTAAAGAGAPPKFNPPKQYYLSLGDSLAFGLQLARLFAMLDAGTYTPDAFNTGYTDVFAAEMRQIRPDLKVVNYGCPGGGGSTPQFMTDSCFFTDAGLALHNDFVGAQLDAAVTFLRDHRGKVGPITLSTGGDDIDNAVVNCTADPACVANSGLAQQLSTNLGSILTQLHDAAPSSEIILYLPHNLEQTNIPGSNAVWQTYVDEMRSIAAAHRARVVDGFASISLAGRQCELTLLCTPDDDPHLSDAGYAFLGHMFFSAAGYGRLRG